MFETAAHLAPGGVVIGETYPPGWDPAAAVGRVGRLGDAEVVVTASSVEGDLLRAVAQYGVDGRTWVHLFTARLLDEPALRAVLVEGGLLFEGWLERPGWFLASAAPAPAG